jgi:hypothetical protein
MGSAASLLIRGRAGRPASCALTVAALLPFVNRSIGDEKATAEIRYRPPAVRGQVRS